jgi:transcriptional regulator with XRE-family HTH domain
MKPAEANIKEVADRIRSLREDMGITPEEMAEATGRSVEEYKAQESGESDLSFTFLYKCAARLGIDVVEILTGENPHLTGYELVRAGEGLAVTRHTGYQYLHKAPRFRNKLCEPFYVTIPYEESEVEDPHLSFHNGQEFDYVLSGRVRFSFEGKHFEDLDPGDSVMYDSGRGHGLAALDGNPAVILAVVIAPSSTSSPSPNDII